MDKFMEVLDNNKDIFTDGEYLSLCNDIKAIYDINKKVDKISLPPINNYDIMLIDYEYIRKEYIENDYEIMNKLENCFFLKSLYSNILQALHYMILNQTVYCAILYERINKFFSIDTNDNIIIILSNEKLDKLLTKNKDYTTCMISFSNNNKRRLKKYIM